jgi:hypothetical protein
MVDAGERLQVLLMQEATIYQTSDYLTRMQKDLEIGSFDQVAADVAAALAEKQQQKQQQRQQIQSSPSSPKKRKSWDDLTSVEESLPGCASHKEQCRRTAATTCASSAASTSAGAVEGGSVPGDGSSAGSTSQINKHWREKICEWAYQGTLMFTNKNLCNISRCFSFVFKITDLSYSLTQLIILSNLIAYLVNNSTNYQQWSITLI